jgi:Nucleotide-diphospho-sugar transferase
LLIQFIVLALVDSAFADMALNLYESSLRPNGIRNFLFVGAGRRACDMLSNASLPCYYYTEDKDTEVASIYKSPEFIRKMNIRTDMILDALSVGFTVLHTDLDVVFLRNPLPDLKVSFYCV